MARTLIKTDTAGWYMDADDQDGRKVRKADGDQIVTQAEFDAAAKAAKAEPAKADEPKLPAPTVALSTGKVAVGKTVTIQCQWKGPENGDGEDGIACTDTRTIKPQDQFQVKFCVEHTKANKLARRRARNKAKTAKRQAEREAAKEG